MPKTKRTSVAKKKTEKTSALVTKIRKRDGSIVEFDPKRIEVAVGKAMKASGENGEKSPKAVADAVMKDLSSIKKTNDFYIPTVEEVQDLVERQLILHRYAQAAKAYILYRDKRSELRKLRRPVPENVRNLVTESKKYFRSAMAEYAFYTFYSRWIDEEGRRESWIEAIDRYVDFMKENIGDKLTDEEYTEIREYMLSMSAMGSMRLLWGAGKAARKNNITAYNCAFVAPTEWKDFADIMYLSMSGSGVGYSVEHQNVERLPLIQRQTGEKLKTFVIDDSKEGWCDALVAGMTAWEHGQDIDFDYSKIRPEGARLNTMGGRASGPEPLRSLLNFTREKMFARQNRRLSTIDVHDIICKIGSVVVAGGVRRSALISVSDLDDIVMREAKNGQFWLNNPQRSMANNSAVYNEKPTVREFLDEWQNLVKAGSGERGIFNRGALKKQLPVRRWKVFAPFMGNSGLNPCGEIILRSRQFCNLSEVVARSEDTEEDLLEKVRVATILGTYQSTLTKFPYIKKEWKENCEAERLLGVSITGQWDCPAVQNPNTLRKMKEVAIETNRKYAQRFGINPSTAITCVKPSGNGSQLFDSASGLHPRHSKYYIRRVRIESHNPIFTMLKDIGVPYHPEVGYDKETATTFVLEFPMKAPETSTRFKDDVGAFEMLEYWKMLKESYTEHNPSATISIGEDEWLEVGQWVYKNWDIVGGLSFLPRSDHVYKLAPYESITKGEYEKRAAAFPDIDFSKLVLYEGEDQTQGAKELACSAGSCEVDIPAPTPKIETIKKASKSKKKVAK
ncbi:ribonucleoside-triphosphate reductase [bacterium]|mgnify:CR=1 FL=1|nr:ribonucleoside-triphosphate reductase [bacterium]|tara:strand:- start:12069 stop:14441 length:2373 start_codon:yes stop_codon:yes gene_type:complete